MTTVMMVVTPVGAHMHMQGGRHAKDSHRDRERVARDESLRGRERKRGAAGYPVSQGDVAACAGGISFPLFVREVTR